MESGRKISWNDTKTGTTRSATNDEFLDYVESLQLDVEDVVKAVVDSPPNGLATVAVDGAVVSTDIDVEHVPNTPPIASEEKPAEIITNTSEIKTDTAPVTTVEKVTEWVEQSEFNETNDRPNGGLINDEDRTLNELLEQVAELDDIYEDHQLRNQPESQHVANELNGLENSMQAAGIADDGDFDDAATYTSLQIAFKNPISILKPLSEPIAPALPPSYIAANRADAVELINPLGPLIALKRGDPVVKPIESDDGEKLPPLPPKRIKKPFLASAEDLSAPHEHNGAITTDHVLPERAQSVSRSTGVSRRESDRSLQRPQSQIIIMKSPSQSPLHKKLPDTPSSKTASCSTLTRTAANKKPGFFSKLFSRRKSKSDLCASELQLNDADAAASIARFDAAAESAPNRASSVRSVALKPAANGIGAANPALRQSTKSGAAPSSRRVGKPCGRSVSSVSGKRPSHLTADVVHIPLKGCDSSDSLAHSGSAMHTFDLAAHQRHALEHASTTTLSNQLDRKTVSALQLADLPLHDGGMELIAIADRQSLKNLCESASGVMLDPSVDLTEAEHYALYTSVAPHATESEFDEASAYYAPVEAGEILTQEEVARRLVGGLP